MPAIVVSGAVGGDVANVLWQAVAPTVTASGSAAGYPAINVTDPATWSSWKASGANGWVEFDLGSATQVDGVGIAAHNLFTSGTSVQVQYQGASRTNLVTYSSDLENPVWTKVRSAVTANSSKAPDGTNSADKIIDDLTSSATHAVQGESLGVLSGQTYTISAFVKAGEHNFVRLNLQSAGFGSNRYGQFNLTTGSVVLTSSGATSGIIPLGNGWWRCWVSAEATSNVTIRPEIFMAVGPLAGDTSYTGDGVSGIYVWGVQLELGATPTSYIPTTSSSVSSTWNDANVWFVPADNSDMFTMFQTVTARYWRVLLTGPAANIGIIQIGKRLVFPHAPLDDYTPLNMAREYRKLINDSLKGQLLGNRVIAAGASTEVDMGYMDRTWVNNNLPAFKSHYDQGGTFFYAGCPSKYPLDMGYCRADGDDATIAVSYVEADKLATVSFPVRAYVAQ